MRKIYSLIFLITLCTLSTSVALGQDMPAKATETNSTVEIDKVFIDSQNYKKHKSKKIKVQKEATEKVEKVKAVESPKQEKVKTAEKTEKAEKSEKNKQKETISKPDLKEIKTQAKIEEEKALRRELQELTDLNKQAIALYTDNNLDESLKVFSKIPEDKRTAEIWLLMGNILMDKGKNDEAVFMYSRAIIVEPTYYKAYYNLGNIYLSEDKFNMAIEQYKRAIKYNTNNPYLYYNLGCAYLKIGDLKKAKYSYIKAVELKNIVPEFHYNLAYVLKKLNKEKQAKMYLNNYNKLTGELSISE